MVPQHFRVWCRDITVLILFHSKQNCFCKLRSRNMPLAKHNRVIKSFVFNHKNVSAKHRKRELKVKEIQCNGCYYFELQDVVILWRVGLHAGL